MVLFRIVFGFFLSQFASAGVVDVDGFGLSVHLGASYAEAPLRFDSRGVYVFNPGVGIGYDFRESAMTSGLRMSQI